MTIRSKQIEIEKLKYWREMSFDKTLASIAEALPKKTPLSIHTIGNTLRTGYATERTYNILDKYYATKFFKANAVKEPVTT